MSLVEYKVGELCSIKHGWAFAGEFFSDEGEYLLLTPGNAYMSGGIKIRPGKEKFYIGEFPKDYLLKKGDILLILTDLVQEAPLLGGSITIPEDNYFLHNQRLGLVENVNTDLVDRRFLYHLFNSPLYRGQVRASASGATVRHTAPGRIYDCSVTIPKDLATQKNISCLLDSIDEFIENNNVIAEKLNEILSSTYQEWFINFKFQNHEQVDFVDGIPKGWEYNELIELFVLQRGFDLSNSKRILGDIPIYASTGIVGYHNEHKVLEKTVITGRSGSLGEVMITNGPSWPLNTTLWVKEFKKFTPEMAYFTLKNLELESFNAGAAVPTLNRNDVHKVKILTPTKEIINEFSKLASQIFDQIHLLKLKNEKLVELKETLLPRLMSGELDVSKLSSIE